MAVSQHLATYLGSGCCKVSIVFTSENATFENNGHALILRVSFLSSPSDISPSDH